MHVISNINAYEQQAMEELEHWKKQMQQSPSLVNKLSKNVQTRINRILPEKLHQAITATVKQMTRAVIFGAGFTTKSSKVTGSLEEVENKVRERIRFYRDTSAAEGAITGAGGFLLGLADFPAWMSLKMKMLFEIATLYGHDMKDYKERVYLLHIFQLTFSSQRHRNKVYAIMENWKHEQEKLPEDINQFDWRNFQQEYRDYLDLAKLLQLIPGVGAVVGAYVNHRLTEKLGKMAINAYRLRRQQAVVKLLK